MWLVAPLFLLVFQSRTNQHTLVGLSPLIFIVAASVSYALLKNKKALLVIVVGVFALINVAQIHKTKTTKINALGVQQGATLHDQISLLDYVYSEAQGNQFSISTLTNPLGYNTTWSYLFHWYGKNKYQYVPSFFGPDQAGIFAGDLLPRTSEAAAMHFTIYEPPEGISEGIVKGFTYDQNLLIASPSATMKFGSLLVEKRVKESR